MIGPMNYCCFFFANAQNWIPWRVTPLCLWSQLLTLMCPAWNAVHERMTPLPLESATDSGSKLPEAYPLIPPRVGQ